MEKQTVFIKRYPSKGEFPKQDGIIVMTTNERLTYSKTFGWVTFQNYTTKAPEWWLEEMELPSEEEMDKSGDDFAYPHIDSAFAFNCFMHGANFILNKLKGENK